MDFGSMLFMTLFFEQVALGKIKDKIKSDLKEAFDKDGLSRSEQMMLCGIINQITTELEAEVKAENQRDGK